eukprot:Colp12_sorted_trinity150504_noHs@29708
MKINPKRCGLRFDPPMLLLEYTVETTGAVRHRKMPIKGFTVESSIQDHLSKLLKRHEEYLHSIPVEQLERLLERLKSNLGGGSPKRPPLQLPALGLKDDGLPKKASLLPKIEIKHKTETPRSPSPEPEPSYSDEFDEEDAASDPAHEENEVDKPSAAHKSDTVHESEEELDSEIDEVLNDIASMSSGSEEESKGKFYEAKPLPQTRPTLQPLRAESVASPAVKPLTDVDLNKVSEEELRRQKQLMEETFLKNKKSKSDPDFQYDVEKAFNPVESNEWDSEQDGSHSARSDQHSEGSGTHDDPSSHHSHLSGGSPAHSSHSAPKRQQGAWGLESRGQAQLAPLAPVRKGDVVGHVEDVGSEEIESESISEDLDIIDDGDDLEIGGSEDDSLALHDEGGEYSAGEDAF